MFPLSLSRSLCFYLSVFISIFFLPFQSHNTSSHVCLFTSGPGISTGKKSKIFSKRAIRENISDLNLFSFGGGKEKKSQTKLLELQRELGLEVGRQNSQDFSPSELRSLSDSSSVTDGSLTGSNFFFNFIY